MDGGLDQADVGAESVHGEGSHASAGGDSELDSLRAQIAEKDKEIAELKDKYLRTLADSENARKRIRQQSDESIRIQREAILRDLLPIIDNLERALAAARDGNDARTIRRRRRDDGAGVDRLPACARCDTAAVGRPGVRPQSA